MENKATDAAVGERDTSYGKYHHDTYSKRHKGFADLSRGLDGTRLRSVEGNGTGTLSVIPAGQPGALAFPELKVAVLLPCRNESPTIAKVVKDFQTVLPKATVYVYDNASTDNTAERAAHAGAIVRYAPEPGKGNVVRRMFSEVEADVYLMADGDDTYDASRAPELVGLLTSRGLDMVVGSRIEEQGDGAAYRPGHKLGNRLFNGTVRALFGERPADMLTGYRAFSRRFAKSFPGMARGFEVETEITLHAMDLRVPVLDVATSYRERPDDSASKLHTVRDGIRILRFLMSLFHAYRPLTFYGAFAAVPISVALGAAVLGPFSLEPWSAPAIVSFASGCLAVSLLLVGGAVHAIRRGQTELKRMIYMSTDSPRGGVDFDEPVYLRDLDRTLVSSGSFHSAPR